MDNKAASPVYIDLPWDDPFSWMLKSYLAFKNSVGQHTGILIEQELVNVIQKFNFDVAAQYVCKELKPCAQKLNAKEICGRYVIQLYHDKFSLIYELK